MKSLNQLGVCSSNAAPSSGITLSHPLTSAQTLNIRAMEHKVPFLFISDVSSTVEGGIFFIPQEPGTPSRCPTSDCYC